MKLSLIHFWKAGEQNENYKFSSLCFYINKQYILVLGKYYYNRLYSIKILVVYTQFLIKFILKSIVMGAYKTKREKVTGNFENSSYI